MSARPAQLSDLEQLLDLFRISEVSSIAQPPERAQRIWSEMLARQDVAVFVSDAGARIAFVDRPSVAYRTADEESWPKSTAFTAVPPEPEPPCVMLKVMVGATVAVTTTVSLATTGAATVWLSLWPSGTSRGQIHK